MSFAHKYARIEDERRFLLSSLPVDLDDPETKRIVDVYWPGTRLRLRRIESLDGEVLQRKMTQKYLDSQLTPQETVITNIYLSAEEYALFSSIEGKELTKTRHRYLYQGSGYSIDIFEGSLQGLCLAELEAGQGSLPDGAVPDFAVCEVTAELIFTGGNLAQTSPQELAVLLKGWLGDRG
jgi:CYTH domain-containing protein